jgi:hypothetical protein
MGSNDLFKRFNAHTVITHVGENGDVHYISNGGATTLEKQGLKANCSLDLTRDTLGTTLMNH